MIDVKSIEEEVGEHEEYEDVNSDIHREYNLLVYKYASLLANYMSLKKEFQDQSKELNFYKERFKNEIRYSDSGSWLP